MEQHGPAWQSRIDSRMNHAADHGGTSSIGALAEAAPEQRLCRSPKPLFTAAERGYGMTAR